MYEVLSPKEVARSGSEYPADGISLRETSGEGLQFPEDSICPC